MGFWTTVVGPSRYLAYTIVVLILLLGGTGLLLKHAWADDAVQRAMADSYKADIHNWQQTYGHLENAKAISDRSVVQAQADKRTLREQLASTVNNLNEVRAHDKATQSWYARCDLPPALYQCLHAQQCDPGTGDSRHTSVPDSHAGHASP